MKKQDQDHEGEAWREPGLTCTDGGFADLAEMMKAVSSYTFLLPEEYRKDQYEGPLYGYYIRESKTFNVVTEQAAGLLQDAGLIGEATQSEFKIAPEDLPEHSLQLKWRQGGPDINLKEMAHPPANVEYYSLQKDVFSRNQGILESRQMADRQAVIAGAGSGGFFTGLELVKAGIGSVIIADDDILAYQNICRHVCGIHDVGKYKVDCFRERAADINPCCRVYTFRDLLQHVDPAAFEEVLWKKSILLCCTDNRHAGYVCNRLADQYHLPMIDAGCGPRASTGEVFYYKPDAGMPCYTCAYGEDTGVDHSSQAVRRKYYATETELEKLHFQPGLFLDIELTGIFEAKLAIDLLMEGEEGYQPKLLPYIRQCTILLNYPADPEVNPYMRLFGEEARSRLPLTWKTGTVQKNQECSYCKAQ